MYSFPDFEPVCSSISGSNSCFLTCIHISQEAGKAVWYFHHLKNFPQFIVICTVKGFGIISKTEINVFLESSCFFYDPVDVGNLIKFWNSKKINIKFNKNDYCSNQTRMGSSGQRKFLSAMFKILQK